MRLRVTMLLLIAGCDPQPPPDPPPAKPEPAVRATAPAPIAVPSQRARPFRVATYNINFGTRTLEEVLRLIDEADADLVALQETTPAQAKKLARRTRQAYPHAHFEPAAWAGGHAILSRVPIISSQPLSATHGPFGALLAVVEIGGRHLQVVSVHLAPTLPDHGSTKAEMVAKFLRTEQTRLREIEEILRAVEPSVPTVLLGDFNTLPESPVTTRLAERRFSDSQAGDLEPTWHWKWRGTTIALRLDYVFHTPELDALSYRVIPKGPSDHYPVVSELIWKDPEPPQG